eukprot:scaffold109755_cov38-Prasinocladus_malaysianus.AAC.1
MSAAITISACTGAMHCIRDVADIHTTKVLKQLQVKSQDSGESHGDCHTTNLLFMTYIGKTSIKQALKHANVKTLGGHTQPQ